MMVSCCGWCVVALCRCWGRLLPAAGRLALLHAAAAPRCPSTAAALMTRHHRETCRRPPQPAAAATSAEKLARGGGVQQRASGRFACLQAPKWAVEREQQTMDRKSSCMVAQHLRDAEEPHARPAAGVSIRSILQAQSRILQNPHPGRICSLVRALIAGAWPRRLAPRGVGCCSCCCEECRLTRSSGSCAS